MLRTLGFLLLPPALIAMGLLACAMLLLFRRERVTRIAIVILLVGYYAMSAGPVPNLVMGSLERRYPADVTLDAEGVQAIVVLADITSYGGAQVGAELNGAAWRRLWRAHQAYRQLDGKIPILFSGGGPPADPAASGPAALAAAERWGVPPARFWLENKSRNTMESGVEVKKLLDQRFAGQQRHRVVLVTSAWHMPRAIWVFTRVGIAALPAPCDFRGSATFGHETLVPSYEAFKTSSLALREVLAMLAYRLGARE